MVLDFKHIGDIMKYKIQNLEKSKVKITLTLEGSVWETELENAYNKHKGKYNITGFRKGKAPRKVIEQNYGEGVFFEDALADSFYKFYFEILAKEKQLQPVADPALNIIEISKEKLIVEATVELQPTVSVKKYTGFKIKQDAVKVTDKDVVAQMNKLVEQNARFVETTDAIKNGDIANFDFVGSVDGVEFEGGKAEGFDLEIGSGRFIEGFEAQLVGAKAGEQVDVNVVFPAQYHAAELASKPALFKCKVNTVKQKQTPELNDELIANSTEYETLEQYKAECKLHLEEQAKKQAQVKLEADILEKIVENTEVEIPDVMINQEVEQMVSDFEMRLMYQGLNLSDYVNHLGQTLEQFKKERREDAKKNVTLRLALVHILEKENLMVTEEDLHAKFEEMAKQSGKSLKETKEKLDEHTLSHVQNDILMSKVLTFLTTNN